MKRSINQTMNYFRNATLLLLLIMIAAACTTAPTEEKQADQAVEATPVSNQSDVQSEPSADDAPPVERVVPKPDKTDLAILDDQTKNSLFYKLGCCAKPDERKKTCCCQEVVDQYRKVREGNDDKLILKIKTEDPFFSDCKKIKKWRTMIETIETPPAVEGEEEDFDF